MCALYVPLDDSTPRLLYLLVLGLSYFPHLTLMALPTRLGLYKNARLALKYQLILVQKRESVPRMWKCIQMKQVSDTTAGHTNLKSILLAQFLEQVHRMQ